MLPLDSTDLLFRIKGGLNLESVLNKTDEAAIKASISESIKDLISKVNSHAFILYGVESALYLWPKTRASTQPTELQENSNCKSILKFVPIEVNDYLKKIPKKKSVKITPLVLFSSFPLPSFYQFMEPVFCDLPLTTAPGFDLMLLLWGN